MKKINLLMVFIFVFGLGYSQAQESSNDNNNLNKIYVSIHPFTSVTGVSEMAVEKAQIALVGEISTNTRFELVELTELDKLMTEKEGFKGYYLYGNVTENMAYSTDKKGKKNFKASFKVQVKMTDPQTNKILYSELVDPRNSAFKPLSEKQVEEHALDPLLYEKDNIKYFTYPTEALAVRNIELQLPIFVNEFIRGLTISLFPIYYKVNEVTKRNRKDLPVELSIVGGSRSYVELGDVYRLVVSTKMNVGGDQEAERLAEIGKVKVIKVEGPDFSVVKIIKGYKVFAEELEKGSVMKVVL